MCATHRLVVEQHERGMQDGERKGFKKKDVKKPGREGKAGGEKCQITVGDVGEEIKKGGREK